VLADFLRETGASQIIAEEDYTPYARRRDDKLYLNLPIQFVRGQTLFHPSALLKSDGSPYTVFTPFSRNLRALLPQTLSPLKPPEKLSTPKVLQSLPVPGYNPSPNFQSGELEGLRRMNRFLSGPIFEYGRKRNRLDLQGTSSLSPYLRFGMVSLRTAVAGALQSIQQAEDPEGRKGAETWLSELIWREFYINILYHFPEVLKQSFRAEMRNISWENDQRKYLDWKTGQTGYPLVDAAMRELAETGWMHNRARMVVASFLVKDLHIDWRWGEAWFMQNLVDGDPAANNGGWQWTAGTGTDAAPYFRIFNPVLQSQKFDPEGGYIRKWVPELAAVPKAYIHIPWKMPPELQSKFDVKIGKTYPEPIVDHRFARQRTLEMYNRRND